MLHDRPLVFIDIELASVDPRLVQGLGGEGRGAAESRGRTGENGETAEAPHRHSGFQRFPSFTFSGTIFSFLISLTFTLSELPQQIPGTIGT